MICKHFHTYYDSDMDCGPEKIWIYFDSPCNQLSNVFLSYDFMLTIRNCTLLRCHMQRRYGIIWQQLKTLQSKVNRISNQENMRSMWHKQNLGGKYLDFGIRYHSLHTAQFSFKQAQRNFSTNEATGHVDFTLASLATV